MTDANKLCAKIGKVTDETPIVAPDIPLLRLPADAREWITKTVTLGGGVGAILYGAGLSVSALFYQARNISWLSLGRIAYLLTGLWFLAPVICAWIIRRTIQTKVPGKKASA